MPHDPTFHLFPQRASEQAGQIDALAWFLLAVSVFFTLLILFLIATFAIRYRRRSEFDVPPETRTHTWMEITWMVIPLAIVMVMFVWGTKIFVSLSRPPAEALQINVVGKQWMWKIQHPGGQREINELHVPRGLPVKLILSSQDVIHDFYLPDFRVKHDVVPGSYTAEWFTATKDGEYHLFCSEYCGTMHSQMVGRVVVMEPAQYSAWLAGIVPDEQPEAAGQRLFTSYGCAACHGQRAPSLAGLFGKTVQLQDGRTIVADENYLRESILYPTAKIAAGYPVLMPSYREQLSEEQVNQLIAYLKTLGAARVGERSDSNTLDAAATSQPADSAALPATRPVNGFPPQDIPNQPPARRPPPQSSSPSQGSRSR